MTRKVVAVCIDAPDNQQFNAWLAQGRLPNIAGIVQSGLKASHTHVKRFRNERCWETFLSGVDRGRSGSVFLADRYGYFNASLQRDQHLLPFYALGDTRKVCMFDLPATISPQVNGIQIAGWASEANASFPVSEPSGLLQEIERLHGGDPKLVRSLNVRDLPSGESERSFSLPSVYDQAALLDLKANLLLSIQRRTAICLDLLRRDDWDLFLTMFSEPHAANHLLWHLGEDYPVQLDPPVSGHALMETYAELDAAIGMLRRAVKDDRVFVLFTLDDLGHNTMDVPSMAMLPELLYRWSFRGDQALAPGDIMETVPLPRSDYTDHWKREVWALRTPSGERRLMSPQAQEAQGDPMSWNPANWYRPVWPQMRAFALPSVADGYIRLNVAGREAQGRVDPADYEAVLGELSDLLRCLTNPRNGRPLVKQLVRTRNSPFEDSDQIPPDLIVCWDPESPADVVDSPELGRVGPLPYFRSGGHIPHGTLIENLLAICGPGLDDAQLRDGRLEDLPATLLDLLGAEIPAHCTGKSLLRP